MTCGRSSPVKTAASDAHDTLGLGRDGHVPRRCRDPAVDKSSHVSRIDLVSAAVIACGLTSASRGVRTAVVRHREMRPVMKTLILAAALVVFGPTALHAQVINPFLDEYDRNVRAIDRAIAFVRGQALADSGQVYLTDVIKVFEQQGGSFQGWMDRYFDAMHVDIVSAGPSHTALQKVRPLCLARVVQHLRVGVPQGYRSRTQRHLHGTAGSGEALYSLTVAIKRGGTRGAGSVSTFCAATATASATAATAGSVARVVCALARLDSSSP